MIDATDVLAVERRLDSVQARVRALARRVEVLEAERVRRALEPEAVPYAFEPAAVSPGATMRAPVVDPEPTRQGVTPPREPLSGALLGAEPRTPTLPLAALGGAALLLGLAFFAWHALENAWVGPNARLGLGAVAAVALTLGAWPLARRGHIAVAGAVGGAGLGAWFSAWLVARHGHDLVSAPQAFVALAAGAAACLAMGGRLRLRLMAGLAGVAACATPALVASGGDRLSELMVYQLGVLAVLVALDRWRGWPELPTMGVLGTAALSVGWAAVHLQPHNTSTYIAWMCVLVVAAAASGWRLLLDATPETAPRTRDTESVHLAARLLTAGALAWGAAWWGSRGALGTLDLTTVGLVTLGLAVWHGALAALLVRRNRTTVAPVALWLGWIQAAAVPPLLFDGASVAVGWAVMALAAAALSYTRRRITGASLLALPTSCMVVWVALHNDASWAVPLGFVAASVPFVAGAWRRREGMAVLPLIALGSLAWLGVVAVAAPDVASTQLAWAAGPVVAVSVAALIRGGAAAGPGLAGLSVAHLSVAWVGSVVTLLTTDGFGAGPVPGLTLGVVVALGGLCAAVVGRSSRSESIEFGGLVCAGYLGVGLAVVGARLLPSFPDAAQTAAIGLPSFALVVAGLRAGCARWRHVGLGAMGVAAAKVVVFDTAGATLAGRALSFVCIGAVLILGAYAYSRTQRRAAEMA